MKELFIIGSGKMAIAIIEGIKDEFRVVVVARDEKKLNELKNKYHIEIKKLDEFDIQDKDILLAIKPYALDEVSNKLKGKANLLISILAGTTIETLKEKIASKSYIRMMPNLAASYKKSMTTLTGDKNFKEYALNLAQKIGNALWVDTQKELDIATALAGSGPAFLALVAEALADGAVKEGIKRDDANTLVKGLFEGFAPLLTNTHPALIKDGVMSPGGTTAAGYFALEEKGTRAAFMSAIKEAFRKTQ